MRDEFGGGFVGFLRKARRGGAINYLFCIHMGLFTLAAALETGAFFVQNADFTVLNVKN